MLNKPNNNLIIIVFSLLFLSFLHCVAQNTNKLPLPASMQKKEIPTRKFPKISVGGSFGFQFGTYNTVELAPQVGLYVLPWMQIIANGQYAFQWSKNYYNSHVWGLGVALQPCIIKKILVHAGYDFNQIYFKWLDGSPTQVHNLHFFTVGGGYKQYISQKVYFYALVLINIQLNNPTIQNYSVNYFPSFKMGVSVDL